MNYVLFRGVKVMLMSSGFKLHSKHRDKKMFYHVGLKKWIPINQAKKMKNKGGKEKKK